MKKIIAVLCVLLLIFAFTGCTEEKIEQTNGGYTDISADMNETEKAAAELLRAVYNGFPLGLVESIIKDGTQEIANVIIREAESVKNLVVDEITVKEICGYNEGEMYAVAVRYKNDAGYVNDIVVIEKEEILFQPLYTDDEQGDFIDTIDAFKEKIPALFSAMNTKLSVSGDKIQTVLSAKGEIIVLKDENGERIKFPEEPVYEKDFYVEEPILIPEINEEYEGEDYSDYDYEGESSSEGEETE